MVITASYNNDLFDSPIFTMPWLVSSQHDCSLRADKLLDCLDEKNPRAASVTWYACNVNSLRAGSIWATAPTASSATFMQSLRVSETILGVRHAHRPASVISLHPTNSSCQTPCITRRHIVQKYIDRVYKYNDLAK